MHCRSSSPEEGARGCPVPQPALVTGVKLISRLIMIMKMVLMLMLMVMVMVMIWATI